MPSSLLPKESGKPYKDLGMTSLIVFVLSALLTYAIKSKASAIGLVDIPNDRSSHHIPTPRGGGAAIILTFFAALIYFQSGLDPKLFWGLCMGIPVALIGLIDDLRPLSARLRMGVQIFSAAGALYFLGGVPRVDFGLFAVSGIYLNLIALLLIVWLTNLYNFLDGLDGYAAAQGIFVSLGGYWLFGNIELLWLASAIGGFLLFNWHKASIFMGDVGSTTLGFLFAVWMIQDAGTSHFSGWLVLLSLFGFDATVTLIRRWRNGEKLTQAHRKHMYQRLHQSGWSHSKVVLSAMSLNLLLLITLILTPPILYLYLLGFSIILLAGILLWIDSKKGFE